MRVKCPKCGYAEEVADVNIGDIVQCPCGHEYAAGEFSIAQNLFSGGQTNIVCPYCGTSLVIPEEAVGRNVRCSECEEKFKIVKHPQPKDPHHSAENNLQKQRHSGAQQAKTANKKVTAVQIENIKRIEKMIDEKSYSPALTAVGAVVKS